MQEVKLSDLRDRLTHYIHLAESGEELVVTDQDRPVARLVRYQAAPVDLRITPRHSTHQEARQILQSAAGAGFTAAEIEEALRWMRDDRSGRWHIDPTE